VNVSASLKHYVGYSFPTTGGDRTPALIPENTLREYFLPAFAAAVKGGAHTVMVNSSEVNGIAGHANGHLLKDVLQGEMGLQGFVVSDWMDSKARWCTTSLRNERATRSQWLPGLTPAWCRATTATAISARPAQEESAGEPSISGEADSDREISDGLFDDHFEE
jgi:hypothetical protein